MFLGKEFQMSQQAAPQVHFFENDHDTQVTLKPVTHYILPPWKRTHSLSYSLLYSYPFNLNDI